MPPNPIDLCLTYMSSFVLLSPLFVHRIVEIKPGNVEAGTALAKMFARHPHLMERCAVVMSFDAYVSTRRIE